MALTGLQIYKLLPKTNCKDCGFPTCLAFSMKLAQQAVELSACPHISEEAEQALAAAARPPIQLVTVGAGDDAISIGNEVVMFRHEKTFFNPTGLVVRVKTSQPLDEVAATVSATDTFSVERVGLDLKLNGIAVEDADGDAGGFASVVESVAAATNLPLILMSKDPAVMKAGLAKVEGRRPLIYAATKDNVAEMTALASEHKCPLAVYGQDLAEVAELVDQASKAGVEELVLDPGARDFAGTLNLFTQIRRLALKATDRLFGYPTIAFPGESTDSPDEETLLAGQLIAKYAGIVVMDHFAPHSAYALLTERLNIFTDPQRPIQVEPGVYPIREPAKDSPVMVTTNFSLSYFAVMGEVEGCGESAWLIVCDTDGQSVLTAWAAAKLDGEVIAKAITKYEVGAKVDHRFVVLPGHVAVLSGEVEEELAGWSVIVGPREAADIPNFLKTVWTARRQESQLEGASR